MHTHRFPLVSLSLRRIMRVLPVALCCMAFAAFTQAQVYEVYDFVVPGVSGPNWVNTGLDLPRNTVLHFTATGKVDVSAGWGSHGPGGTDECARVSGYPIDPRDPLAPQPCYGLGATITESRTSPESGTPWTYAESRRYSAAPRGGHLWLTVNDDNPVGNTGYFKVRVEVTTFPDEIVCKPCPSDHPTRQGLRGEYPNPKAMRGLLALGGQITAINKSRGTTLVFVSQGTVLAKYGDLPDLKIAFEKGAARNGPSLSKERVIQGVLFQNDKMSLITGASQLKPNSKTDIHETKPDTKQIRPD